MFPSMLPYAIGRERSKGGNQAAATSVLDRDRGGSPPPSSGLSGEQLAVTGIKNLGNTCFLNVVLQSLASFHVFREYLEVSAFRQVRRLSATWSDADILCQQACSFGRSGTP